MRDKSKREKWLLGQALSYAVMHSESEEMEAEFALLKIKVEGDIVKDAEPVKDTGTDEILPHMENMPNMYSLLQFVEDNDMIGNDPRDILIAWGDSKKETPQPPQPLKGTVDYSDLRNDLENILNVNSSENGSDTPDFILAEYLVGCLEIFDKTVSKRTKWYKPDKNEECSNL